MVWRKEIINCVFNSICSLPDIDNGVFHRDPHAIAKRIVYECVAVASKKGILLNTDDVIENLSLIRKSSDTQLISSLQGIREGLPTEIDTLNFEVVRVAKEFGMEGGGEGDKIIGGVDKLKSACK